MTSKDAYHLPQTKPRFFYGWWIVGACFLIYLFVPGVLYFGFTAFFEPIANEFGWSYAQISLAASLRGLEMGILAPLLGLAVDRYGPRRLTFAGTLVMAIGIVLLGRADSLAVFYGAFILISVGTSACSGVVVLTAVANWFQRKASLAMGLVQTGVASGGLMIPLATVLIDTYGWRTAILSLGLGTCGLVLVLSLLLRHKPEQYGYLPDGVADSYKITEPLADIAQVPDTMPKIGPREALASRTFWHMALSFMGCFMVVNAVLTHIMPYLSIIGINRSISSLLAAALPICTVIGRLGFGWLGDRFDKKRLTALTAVGICLGVLFLSGINAVGMWLAIPFVLFLSIGWGGNAIMMAVLVRTYFGRDSFGSILGFIMGVSLVGQIVGPTLAGWIFDAYHSYQGAWYGGTVLLLIAAIVMVTTPPISKGAKLEDKNRE